MDISNIMHYLPQVQQKEFKSNEHDMLFYTIKTKYKTHFTNNVLRGYRCYHPNDKIPIYLQETEKHLANEIDARYKELIQLVGNRLINSDLNDENIRQIYSIFMYCEKLKERNPETIKGYEEWKNNDEYSLEIIRKFEIDNNIKIPPQDIPKYIENMKNSLDVMEMYNDALMREEEEYLNSPAFNQFFNDRVWGFFHNTTDTPFIISDDPIIINCGKVKVGVPLTKSIYLIALQPPTDANFIQHIDMDDVETINKLNRQQASQSRKYLMGGEFDGFLRQYL